jgi:hypothetical protein
MKNIFLLLFLIVSFQTIHAEQISQNDDEIQKMATPLLENILLGIEKRDYQLYSKDFDDSMKEALPESKFINTQEQINTQFGKIKITKYFGFLNKGRYTQVIWKGKADKTKDDVLIQLVVSKINDKLYIAGLWFK